MHERSPRGATGSLPLAAVRAEAIATIPLVVATAVHLRFALTIADVAVLVLLVLGLIDIPAAISVGTADRTERRRT